VAQLLERTVLVEHAVRPLGKRGALQSFVGAAREHHHARAECDERRDERDRRASVAEIEVEQHHVGGHFARELEHDVVVERRRDDGLDALHPQRQRQTVREHVVVFDDEDPRPRRRGETVGGELSGHRVHRGRSSEV